MVLALLPLQALVGSIQFVRTRRNRMFHREYLRERTPLIGMFCRFHSSMPTILACSFFPLEPSQYSAPMVTGLPSFDLADL